MEKLRRFLLHTPAALVVGILAFFNPFLFYLSTDFHGCFADIVPGSVVLMRVLQAICAVGILGFLFVRNLGKGERWEKNRAVLIAYFVMAILTCLFTIGNFVILILLSSSIPMARYYFELEAPVLLFLAVVVSMAFVLPRLGNKVKVIIVVAVYVLCGVLLLAVDWWHLEPFDFCTQPVVFDTGEDYSIVWSTTDVSQGYVVIADKEYTDSSYGRLYSNRTIHHVNVPYDELDGKTYTVYATRMLDNEPYFAQRGKTISATRTFKGKPTGDIEMAVITDNHCYSRAKFAKVRQDGYNCVLMLGDFSDFVHQELDISDFLLYPAWYLSDGEVPVLYAKGNHDTHSEIGADLAYLLGFDQLYYRTIYGDYTFTVLDSGSCNVDLEEEKYAGVGRYIEYCEKQLDWLASLPAADKYEVAVVHVWDYASVAEGIHNDQAAAQVVRYNTILHSLGVDFQLSGHKHDFQYFADGVDGIDVPLLRCGGIQGGLIGHTLTYTTLRFSQGQVEITAYNTAQKDAIDRRTVSLSQ